MHRKTIIPTALLFFCFSQLIAQNPQRSGAKRSPKTYSYIYDYSKMDPTMDKDPQLKHKRDKVLVVINNINRLIFDVSATGVNRSINMESTNIFDSLNKSLATATAKSGTAGHTKEDSSLSLVDKGNPANVQKIRDLQDRIKEKQGDINSKVIEINRNLVTLRAFSALSANVPVIISGERYSQNNIKSRIVSTANQINSANSNRLKPSSTIGDFDELSTIINTIPIQSIATIANDTAAIVQDIKVIEASIKELKQLCRSCDFTETISYLEQIDFKEARNVNSRDVTKVVNTLNNLFNQVNDPVNFKYISPYFYPDGDELDLSIKIQPKEQYRGIYSADSISKMLNINGKFEWSIGPAVNFSLSKSLFDYSYSIDSSRDEKGIAKQDTFNIAQNRIQNKAVPSIGVMANFYWQHHSTVTPGVTIGLSTSATDLSQVRIYLGGSLFVGGLATDNNKNLVYNKIIFSFGIAYAQVNRLKGNLNLGDNPKSQIPYTGDKIATDQLTERVGKFGLYFGLSYKLN